MNERNLYNMIDIDNIILHTKEKKTIIQIAIFKALMGISVIKKSDFYYACLYIFVSFLFVLFEFIMMMLSLDLNVPLLGEQIVSFLLYFFFLVNC